MSDEGDQGWNASGAGSGDEGERARGGPARGARQRRGRFGSSQSKEWRLIEKAFLSLGAEQRTSRRWGVFFKLLTFVYLFLLLMAFVGYRGAESVPPKGEKHVGFVDLYGAISADTDTNADALTTGLRRAFEADQSVAVVLRINSPGGSPVQSDLIYREIRRLREEYPDKKLYAVITDVGASGAYYIAAAADEIYANESSIVGSIGVIAQGFGFKKLLEKVGIERRVFAAGDNKSMLDPFEDLSDRQVAHFEGVLAKVHDRFQEAVKEGRGERLSNNADLFSGLFWTGADAMKLGLVDGLMSPGQVARDVVGVDEFYDYTWRPDPITEFTRLLGISLGEGVSRILLNLPSGYRLE